MSCSLQAKLTSEVFLIPTKFEFSARMTLKRQYVSPYVRTEESQVEKDGKKIHRLRYVFDYPNSKFNVDSNVLGEDVREKKFFFHVLFLFAVQQTFNFGKETCAQQIAL